MIEPVGDCTYTAQEGVRAGFAGELPPTHDADGIVRLGLATVTLSDVQPQALQWLWPDRIPLGKLTIISGDPGLGKSLLMLDTAARVSANMPWADRRDESNPAGRVILISGEDDIADTVRPRLDAAHADCRNIVAIEGVQFGDYSIEETFKRPYDLQKDLQPLRELVERTGDVRLIVIDPISAFCGKVDSHNNTEVRGLLWPLAELAAEMLVAIVCVSHLNKNAQSGSAVYRTMGSLAFVAAARASCHVIKDRDDPTRRLFLPGKCNLSVDPGGLAFRIEGNSDGMPVIAWEPGRVDITADEALRPAAPPSPRDEVCDWLRDKLRDAPAYAHDIQQAAEDAGFSWRRVQRARVDIGARSERSGFQGQYLWSLKDAPHCRLSSLSPLSSLSSRNAPTVPTVPRMTPDSSGEDLSPLEEPDTSDEDERTAIMALEWEEEQAAKRNGRVSQCTGIDVDA